MTVDPENPREYLLATVELSIAGKRVRLQLPAPATPVRAIQLLPMFQSLADSFVELAVKSVQEAGRKVSCRKGCGACCRQLVPISAMEAHRVCELVDEMPEPRRSQVVVRFEAARQRLEEAGLLARLLAPEEIRDDQAVPLGVVYFSKRIACPFLEEESCSIHADRPVACREYLVTSPAENCARPTPETVHCVDVTMKASKALLRMGASPGHGPIRWAPLALALTWAQAHPEDRPRRPGTELVREFFGHLAGADVPGVRT